MQYLMWVHPILQFTNFFLAAYALYLGYARFRALHMGVKGVFAWKRHVLLGIVAMSVWLSAYPLGGGMAWLSWNAVMVTAWHYKGAFVIAPMLVFGLASGYVLDRYKKKRTALPLAHAINNAILVLLTLGQLASGIKVIKDFILP